MSWKDERSRWISKREWLYAARLAWERDKSFRQPTTYNSGLLQHMVGCIGEVVVANDIGCQVDQEIYPEGDRGWDFKPADLTIDVKATSQSQYPVLRVEEGSVDADMYLFAHVSQVEVTFLGCAFASDVLDAPVSGDVHRIDYDDLRDWPENLERDIKR